MSSRTLFDEFVKPMVAAQKAVDDICRRKHGGNLESVAANQAIHESKEATREKIYLYAVAQGERGITADEVAAEWGVTHNHVAPRISELRRDGRLVPTLKRRKTRSGCTARVLICRPA